MIKVSVRVMQRFGSWVSRYSAICVFLKPLTRTIHQSYVSHISRPDISFVLSDDVLRAIRIFRAIFLSSLADEERFTRSIASFSHRPPSVTIEFDASLFGGGILWFDAIGVCVGACSISLSSLGFGNDSSFQNTAEFIVAVIGLLGAVKILPGSSVIGFRGDSLSALSWLQKGSFKSDPIRNASILFIHLCVKYGLIVGETLHIPAGSNLSADELSRGGTVQSLLTKDSRLDNHTPEIKFDDIDVLLEYCNPSICYTATDEGFITHWNNIKHYVGRIIGD